tara:strand:+ start:4671 stop:5093 length:423 start_codon:yes stop_codon:yes gene_type:complete
MKKNLREVFEEIYSEDQTEDNQKNEKSKEDIREKASKILIDSSNSAVKWNNIFSFIDEFRSDIVGDKRQDSTATDIQAGRVVPLILLFALILRTDMLMDVEDTYKFINSVKDQFKTEEHLKVLKRLLRKMNLENKSLTND